MLGLLGKKLGQTNVYDAQGVLVPVTVVLAGPNRVIQTKTVHSDGYNAVQLGFDDQKEHRVTKPLLGHFKKFGAAAVKRVREFRDFTLASQTRRHRRPRHLRPGRFCRCHRHHQRAAALKA